MRLPLLFGLMLLLVISGCGRALSSPFGGSGRDGPVTVEVVNHNYSDVNVYSVIGGQSLRLGTVTGLTTARLSLDEDRFGGGWGLRLRIEPIGSRERYTSPEVMAFAGGHVVLEIGAELSMSHISLR